jgi:hypothetical protein
MAQLVCSIVTPMIKLLRSLRRGLKARKRIAIWERDMAQATTQAAFTSQTIAVEHIRISSVRPFTEVRRKLEATVPRLGAEQRRPETREGLRRQRAQTQIFGVRDHGALLQISGRKRNALQYDIGNPLTASKMTRHQLPALSTLRCGWFCLRMSKAEEVLNMTGRHPSLAITAMTA